MLQVKFSVFSYIPDGHISSLGSCRLIRRNDDWKIIFRVQAGTDENYSFLITLYIFIYIFSFVSLFFWSLELRSIACMPQLTLKSVASSCSGFRLFTMKELG